MQRISSRAFVLASLVAGVAVGGALFASARAQSPQPTPPSPSKQAVENRKAAYTLIGNYFRYFGAVAKGTVPYDEAEATKRATRIAFLSGIVEDAFPEGSNVAEPDSKAKPDVWSNRADFDKKLKDFQAHAQALAETNAKEKAATDSLKTAIASLAQDCKGCHETYKAK
ncbi:cytochrome c [Methylocystis echinoides]|uniref:c-type cytochrome n=1 Tax=Methylocystis echinoides TaxID=29468 RepID=UPI0034437BFA